ncbi:MAG: LysR family transcriptional regulator [Burkholderia sp.]|nr:LysR family transcriptional regulator [Burkholderia sp.]
MYPITARNITAAMELKDVDLNLLLVFHHLLIERRVSVVAEKLGVTQPGVSNALKRLRLLLGDELFLRTSRGMEPTPYATQLAEPIGSALRTIHDSLNEVSTFDPATSTRKFTLGMSDIGEIHLLPRLMETLAVYAPSVSISTVRNTMVNLQDEIEAGRVDLAIGLLPQLKSGYFQRRLFKQRYVCMFRKGHALDKQGLTVEEFAQADHVIVISGGTGHAIVEQSIEREGIKRNIRLTVPHFVAVGHILSTSNMIATVPERYAMECAVPFGLKYAQHPVALPEVDINVFWHAKFHKDPASQWMRGIIFDTFANGAKAAERYVDRGQR